VLLPGARAPRVRPSSSKSSKEGFAVRQTEGGFSGFPAEGLRFLKSLKRNNRRDWFQPRKEIYESALKRPMTELVEAINADLAKVAPGYVTETKKAIFR